MDGGQDIWEARERSIRKKVDVYGSKSRWQGKRNNGRRFACLKGFEFGRTLICKAHQRRFCFPRTPKGYIPHRFNSTITSEENIRSCSRPTSDTIEEILWDVRPH